MGAFIDLIGKRFHRLTVLQLVSVGQVTIWLCQCKCGKTTRVRASHLKTGDVKSCGCLRRASWKKSPTNIDQTKHGGRYTSEYSVWCAIKARCFNKAVRSYKDYGQRGITMCEEWRNDFGTFLRDVGPRPTKRHSIDRFPNNDGHYEPGNVRWATRLQQNQNKRSNRLFIHNGEVQSLKVLCRSLRLNYKLTHQRIYRYHWSLERAFAITSGHTPERYKGPGTAPCRPGGTTGS